MIHAGWTALMVCAGLAFSLVLTVQPGENSGNGLSGNQQEQAGGSKVNPQEGEIPKKRPQDPGAVERRDYMRVKLMFSQNIIEGLTMNNFETIRQAGHELRNVTTGAPWNAVDSDEYRFQSREFQRSVDNLVKAAESGNIEATTMRFFAMTTKCVDCHEHLRIRSDF